MGRVKQKAAHLAKGGIREVRRRLNYSLSDAYEFPVPAGYRPRNLVIHMSEVSVKDYLLLPEGSSDPWPDDLEYSEVLGRRYRYLEPGRNVIRLDGSGSLAQIRLRIMPWGQTRRKRPDIIYISMENCSPAPLGQRSRLVMGKLV